MKHRKVEGLLLMSAEEELIGVRIAINSFVELLCGSYVYYTGQILPNGVGQ